MKETVSRSVLNLYRDLRPHVSLYTPKNYTLQAQLENVKLPHRDSNQGHSKLKVQGSNPGGVA